jgi:hypothetical protein
MTVFNPGEPLNLDALNNLYKKVTETETSVAAIQNSNRENPALKVTSGRLEPDLTPLTKKISDVTISFGTTYITKPSVVITPFGMSNDSMGKLFYYIEDYSTTNARINYWTDEKWTSGKVGFFWVAVGPSTTI